jgi:hypothetical protein
VYTTSFWTEVMIQSVRIRLLLLWLLGLWWWDRFELLGLPRF